MAKSGKIPTVLRRKLPIFQHIHPTIELGETHRNELASVLAPLSMGIQPSYAESLFDARFAKGLETRKGYRSEARGVHYPASIAGQACSPACTATLVPAGTTPARSRAASAADVAWARVIARSPSVG